MPPLGRVRFGKTKITFFSTTDVLERTMAIPLECRAAREGHPEGLHWRGCWWDGVRGKTREAERLRRGAS